ncbi:MAG: CHAT domain-containing protein [Bacteroidetes bacterium]|nr:CHAT domain-containing protein [Bacteroidota bacterium]
MRIALITIFNIVLLLPCRGQSSVEKKIDSLIAHGDYTDAGTLIDLQKDNPAFWLNKKSEVLLFQGKLDEAQKLLSQLNYGNDGFAKAITLNNFGYLNLLKGRSDKAQDYLEQARDEFKKIGKDNTREAAKCFSNLGLLFWSLGKYNQAEDNARIALQLRQTLFGNESEEVAASLNNLGLIYGNTNADEGLSYYEKALVVYERLYGKENPKIAVASTNIGLMYLKLQLYGDAVNNFETALTIWKKTYPGGHPNEALVLVNLGRTYIQMKNTKAALDYFEKALSIYRKSYGDKHPDMAVVYNQIGLIKLSDNKFSDALNDFQNALCANSPTFASLDLSVNPSVQSFYNGKVLLFSLRLKAQALESLYYGQTLKLQNLKSALSSLQSCDTLIDNIRHGSNNENDKIELGAIANEAYEDGVRISQSISQLTPRSKQFKELAFYFAEKSKSAVLQESIADTQAKSFAGIPEELLEEEKNKKSTIALLNQKLSEKPEGNEEKYLRTALFNSSLEYDQFIKKLELDYPAYYNLKFNSSTASVQEIQKLLSPTKAVVSFFVAEKSKKVYQFVVTPHRLNVFVKSLPDNFDRLCKGFINSLLYSNIETYQSAQDLFRLLKPRVPSHVKSIVIIPSDKISTLPFEAFALSPKHHKDFTGIPFFINRWTISYEFAAGLMLQKSKEKEEIASEIFLCAPVKFNPDLNLNDLPGTKDEVESIAKLFTSKAKISTYAEANESFIKSKEIEKYNYLHFATHGIVDSTDPASSEIFLNSGGTDDGNLFCREIYNLKLGADLVVLSACETGLGKFSKGEGVIGLSRALTYAGANNIIVSFWKVADKSTSELMIAFYKHLLEDKNSYSHALQQAKLDIIRQSKYASPYYWAPFVLIGK